MDNRYNERCLTTADQILRNHFRPDMFSFDGIADCAVCLVKGDSGWDVYLKERDTESDKITHLNVIDAIVDMINRIGGTESEKIRSEFYETMFEKVTA